MVMSFYSDGKYGINFLIVDLNAKTMLRQSEGSSRYRYTQFDVAIRVTGLKSVINEFQRLGFVLKN